MAATEWLLIGGPADGKKVTILHGAAIEWIGEDGKRWLYQGRNYLHRGRLYRIGLVDADDAAPNKVARMIDATATKPIGGPDVPPNC